MYQPSGAESYSGPDLKRWGAGTLGLGRGGAAAGGGGGQQQDSIRWWLLRG